MHTNYLPKGTITLEIGAVAVNIEASTISLEELKKDFAAELTKLEYPSLYCVPIYIMELVIAFSFGTVDLDENKAELDKAVTLALGLVLEHDGKLEPNATYQFPHYLSDNKLQPQSECEKGKVVIYIGANRFVREWTLDFKESCLETFNAAKSIPDDTTTKGMARDLYEHHLTEIINNLVVDIDFGEKTEEEYINEKIELCLGWLIDGGYSDNDLNGGCYSFPQAFLTAFDK
ncbi:hypothetical protein IB292_03120 [Vibrio parahaemolyticus]|uniref:Uncharacterized protein n=1 Tax=Vibrio parahaemolyticus TaxID=670 RepID=A0A9Q3U9Y2_VIBPH|nr:hypothetical protein [Vibrio parahaemolyticus]MCC3804023.1 hypothetical protein [Vibrio parahaemolyticus]